MSFTAYFESHGVDITERVFYIKTLRNGDGQQIQALALPDGGLQADGQASCAYFVLSDSLTDQNLVLDKAFVKENRHRIRIIEPEDIEDDGGNHPLYGMIFLDE